MPPSVSTLDAAGKPLNNDEIKQFVEELRSLIVAEPKYIMRKDDEFLLRYLHSTEFKLSDALKRLKIQNQLRLESPNWFASTPPSDCHVLMSMKTKAILSGRDRSGRRIFYTKLGTIDAQKTTMHEVARFDDLWLEAILDEAETLAHGVCCIMDMSGFSWRLFRWLTPSNIRVGSRITDNLPVKKLIIHIVNSSMLLNAAVTIVFPFLSAKTKEQMHFHYENWPSLHKFIDPEHLPEEYGGYQKSIDWDGQNKWLIAQSERLMRNFKNDNRL